MNTITIQFCEEDRKRIDELIAFAGLLVGELKGLKTSTQPEIPQVVETNTTPEEAPAVEPVIEEPAAPVEEPTPEVKPVSLAEFQKAVTMAVSKGAEAKKKVKAVINQYAPSVSEVPEDKRAEVMAELAQL